MKAFEFTRMHCTEYGETQMKLYYNDYNTHSPLKADGIARLVAPIYQAGFLDGIGMQEHDAINSPSAVQWITSYNKFEPVCNEMAVTELDVTTGFANPSPSVLATQANQYGQLFKCFVERSFFSGRGKIINVSKDGLNDTYTFKTNQSSSLWNGQNQCKPAFYAVVDVGNNYNTLDSLIAYSDTLQENNYTPVSWSNFSTVLSSAKNAININYSNSVSAADALGNAVDALQAAIEGLILVTFVEETGNNIPGKFALYQNYPNPFNPSTRISYGIPRSEYISIKIYDVLGNQLSIIYEGIQQPGKYVVLFDGSELAGGVYFYCLQAGSFIETKKFILLK
jgi:hypothetical protein